MNSGLNFSDRFTLSKDYYAWLKERREKYGPMVADHPMTVITYLDTKGLIRCRRRRKIVTMTRIKWAAFFGVFWGITPLIFRLADQERGYDGTGGEIFIPLIPIIALIIALLEKRNRRKNR